MTVARFALNLTFFAIDLQSVLARDGSDRGHQWCPSVFGFDLVEAQKQAWMETVVDRAYVTVNPAVSEKTSCTGSHEVLLQAGMKPFAWPGTSGIDRLLEANEKSSSVGDGARWNRAWLFRPKEQPGQNRH